MPACAGVQGRATIALPTDSPPVVGVSADPAGGESTFATTPRGSETVCAWHDCATILREHNVAPSKRQRRKYCSRRCAALAASQASADHRARLPMGEALRRWATWDLLVSHAGTTRAAARAAGVSPTAGHFYGHRYRTVTDAMAARIDAAVVRLDLVAAPHPPGDETPSPAVPARARHSKRGRAEVAGADGRSQWDAEMRAALDATEHGTTERRRNKAWREVVRLLGESMLPREVVDHIGATESDWLAWTSQKGKTSRIVRRPVDTHHHDALRALAESELERMSVVESRPLSAEDATWRGYGPQPD